MLRRTLAAGTVVAIISTGCAISADQSAREIPDPPADLFDSTTTEAIVPEEARPDFQMQLYFYNEANQLVEVERPRDTRATPQDTITALSNQPTPEEIEATPGLNSKLGGFEYTTEPDIVDGVLTVTVDDEELRTSTEPDRVALIYRQIACTINALDDDITRIQILDGAGQIPVLVGAVPEVKPVGPADFTNSCQTADELAGSTTTTTTTTRSTGATTNPTRSTANPTTSTDTTTGPPIASASVG